MPENYDTVLEVLNQHCVPVRRDAHRPMRGETGLFRARPSPDSTAWFPAEGDQ